MLDNLKQDLLKKQEYIEKLERISQEFVSLREYKGRWSHYLCAKEVNQVADKVDFAHSCGCCPDSILYARPYVEREGLKIYSDPVDIYIGEMEYYGGDIPLDNWLTQLEQENITNQSIIDDIYKYFQDNPPGRVDD